MLDNKPLPKPTYLHNYDEGPAAQSGPGIYRNSSNQTFKTPKLDGMLAKLNAEHAKNKP